MRLVGSQRWLVGSQRWAFVAELASRLGDDDYVRLDRQLQQADGQLATRYPGDAGVRHLVHTGYAPAALPPRRPYRPGLAGD